MAAGIVCVPPLKFTVPVKGPVNEPKGLLPAFCVLIVPKPATPFEARVKVFVPMSKTFPLLTVNVFVTEILVAID